MVTANPPNVKYNKFSPEARAAREKAKQKEKTFDLPPGYKLPSANFNGRKRPPGTLLLNMLIKNEREHLDRTLPKWAKIIDYWIIGVDDNNTDDSEAIIQKHLGHIPGKIHYVHFDGMGPTWTVLVKEGYKSFPEATHGILADADFAPMKSTLNKMELDVRCSKHMYTIWTEDHRNERKMDWIYRNVAGVVVRRRTHQILEVPELPDQEVFQTLIDLPVDEREGGWGDRAGNKQLRYIGWLEKDLAEIPGDTRTLYYLGYAHFDIFNSAKERNDVKQSDWDHLAKGVEYFKKRAENPEGNEEELWFALLKLGEIYERFYQDWTTGEKYYLTCSETDPERADSWFYIGQHYRLRNEIPKALPYLLKSASLSIPERSLFQWHYLYFCLSKLEYGRAINSYPQATKAQLKEALNLLNQADCRGGDPGNLGEAKALKDMFTARIAKYDQPAGDPKELAVKKLVKFYTKNVDDLDNLLGVRYKGDIDELTGIEIDKDRRVSWLTILVAYLEKMQEFQAGIKQRKDKPDELAAFATCRNYRQASTPYLKFIKRHQEDLPRLLSKKAGLWDEWNKVNAIVRTTCR